MGVAEAARVVGGVCSGWARSAFFGFPLDPLVAGYVYRDRGRFLLYPLMAAAGSAVGCIFLYIVGHKGGEAFLEKKISRAKFERIRRSFFGMSSGLCCCPRWPRRRFPSNCLCSPRRFWR